MIECESLPLGTTAVPDRHDRVVSHLADNMLDLGLGLVIVNTLPLALPLPGFGKDIIATKMPVMAL